jgi:Mg/Co/Ni transporter MgtE
MFSGGGKPENSVLIGQVVDTNDPQGRGRLRVYCKDLGDAAGIDPANLPWCQYVTPFGGMVNADSMSRGPGDHKTAGSVAYGFWALPKINAEVVIMCINGDPSRRIFLGCLPPAHAEHTMPHGRYIDGDGPYSSEEQPIEPLYSNLKKSFGDTTSPEYQSRMVDCGVTGVNQDHVDSEHVISKKPDQQSGYKQSRVNPDKKSQFTDKNYDSQIYSLTTPGFHSLSLDDSADSCRVRLRSSGGHHIILDDSNERIYINTAEGNNWIEIDQDGTIDIYATQSINIKSDTDINLTSDKSVRIHSKNIHFNAEENIRMSAGMDITHDCNDHTIISKNEIATSSNTTNYNASGQFSLSGQNTSIKGNKLGLSGSNIVSSKPIKLGGVGSSGSPPKVMAERVKKIADPLIRSEAMKSMPPEELGATMKEMPPADLNESLSDMSPSMVGEVMDNVPTDDLMDIMPNIDPGALNDMMDNIPVEKLNDIASMAPSEMFGDVLNNLDPSVLNGALDNIDMDVMGKIPSDLSGELLNKLPTDGVLSKISKMAPETLMNIPTPSIQNLVNNLPDIHGVMDMLPMNVQALTLPSLDPSKILNRIARTPMKNLPSMLQHLPEDTLNKALLNANSDTQQAVRQVVSKMPGFNTAKLLGFIPNNYKDLFTGNMKMPDLEKRLKSMPGPILRSVVNMLPKEEANLLLGGMSTHTFGIILQNYDDPKKLLDKLETNTLNTILRQMPGGSVLANITNGKFDLQDMTSRLGNYSINGILSSMNGGDMMPMMNQMVGTVAGIKNQLGDLLSSVSLGGIGDITNIMPQSMSLDSLTGMFGGVGDVSKLIPGNLDLSSLGNFKGMEDIGSIMTSMDTAELGAMMDKLPMGDLNSIIDQMDPTQLTDMLSNMDTDDLSNLIDKMPAEMVDKVKDKIPEEKKQEFMDKLPDEVIHQMVTNQPAKPNGTPKAVFPNRIPMHEPWVRSGTTDDYDKTPKYNKDNPNTGSENKPRNDYWRA